MANYNKSFNFRNGVQVDDDNFLVRSSLVGIGTTIPRATLDVYGTVKANGLVTTTNLYVSGIATFNDIQIGTGISISGNSGAISAKFYGDGSGLYNIPTSQWVDVDPAIYPGVGVGYSSIWAGGTVGIGTTVPRSWLQIGGDPAYSQNGVGISSTGNINATGIVTAGSFVGSGNSITSINASNISSGTLNNSRLPSNISVSGVVTATTFVGQVNAGLGTITTLSGTTGTITNFSSTNLSGTIGTITTLNGTTGAFINLTSTNLNATTGTVASLNSTSGTITNLSGTIGTVTNINSTNGTITNLSGTIGTVTTLNTTNLSGTTATVTNLNGTNVTLTNVNSSGISTLGIVRANQISVSGATTTTTLQVQNLRIGYLTNQIDTIAGDLVLDSQGGLLFINDNLDVSGSSVFQQEVVLNSGIRPHSSNGNYLGTIDKRFSEGWIGDLKFAVGVGNSNKIETITQDLVLDAVTNKVTVDANLNVTGISTLTGNVTLGAGIEPASDLGASLGSASKRFSSSQIGGIRVGVAQTFEIDTVSGTDLVLNSSSGTTRINDDVFISGIGSFGGELTSVVGIIPGISKGAYIGTSGKPFSEAFIDEIRIGVAGTNKIDTREGSLLLNAANNLVNVENNFVVSGLSTFTGNVTVGSNNEVFVNTTTNRVGIGTNVLTRKFQVKDVSNLITEFRTDSSDVTIGVGRSAVGAGQSVGKLAYSNNILNLTNEDLGGLEFITHTGNAGVNTGSFRWRWGKNLATPLMDLTYDGKLGLGITNPSNTLHVIGSSNITGNAFFGGDVTISGSLNTAVNLPAIIGANISTTTGISTFKNIETLGSIIVSTGSSIGIGTTVPIVPLDVRNQSALFGSVGIGTTLTNQTLRVSGSTLLQSVSIGNTTFDDGSGVNVYGGTTTLFRNTISGVSSSVVIFDSTCAIGIGSTLPKCALDYSDAGKNVEGGKKSYMILPILTTSERIGLSTYEGAIVFNTTTKEFQGYTGVGWSSFGSGVGIADTANINSSQITVSGIVTASSFVGDGSGLTGIVGSGSGVIIKNNNVTVGTAGTINFGNNLTVTPISAGIVTVNAGFATAVYASLAGIATYATTAGIATYSNITGVATYASIAGIATYAINAGVSTSVIGGIGSITQLSVSGISTFAGITTVSGATLFAKQLNTSGIATINLLSSGLSSGLEFINPGGFGKFRLGADGGDSTGRLSWYNSTGFQQMAAINASLIDGALDIYNYATGSQNITISAGNAVVLQHGGANTKLQTTSSGVTITGNLLVGTGVTIYGNSGIVSATTFYGNVVGNITGSITDATNLTGGYANASQLNVTGVTTISAGRIQADAGSNLRFGNLPAGSGSSGRNIAIGDQVLYSLNGGSGRNIGIGELSLYETTSGQYNIGLGINAGQKITTGSYNVLLGGYNGQTGLDLRTSSNNVVISDGQGNIRQYINSSGNVGIKTTVVTEALTVAGVVSATSFYGTLNANQLTGVLPAIDGSNLFGVTASGTGIIIRDDGSVVGTAGTIDFGSNLSVSFASGIATVSGASSVSAATTAYGLAGSPNVTLGRVLAGVSTFNTGILDVYNTSGTILGAAYVRTGGAASFGFDGTNTFANHGSLTGDFNLLSETSIKLKSVGYVGGVETYAEFVKNSGVSLYYDNVNKFETTGYGITVYGGVNAPTGVITASSFVGSGANLTSLPAGQLTGTLPAIDGSALLNVNATGSGIVVLSNGVNVGSARTVNFGTGLGVTYTSSGIATITASGGSLQSRTTVIGVTTSIVNNGIGNTDITGFKSYALMKVGLSTAGWLRLYTDSASRTADASRSQGIDPSPGSGVIAEVITTGISTTQIITPFVMGGNLDEPSSTTIYAAITNLSGSTQAITANLTILQLEA